MTTHLKYTVTDTNWNQTHYDLPEDFHAPALVVIAGQKIDQITLEGRFLVIPGELSHQTDDNGRRVINQIHLVYWAFQEPLYESE